MRIKLRGSMTMSSVLNAERNPRSTTPTRKATNVTLPGDLLTEAKALGLNVSQACEAGLTAAVSAARGAAWLKQNRAAIAAMNDYVETNGLPLEEFRQF